jgi:uncharacterized SAM-binding protein YcdF (DUF218 family)
MQPFLSQLKGLCTVLNIFIFLLCIAYGCKRWNKKKGCYIFTGMAVVFFLLCATHYVPNYLAVQLEKKCLPFSIASIKNTQQKFYIHVLGSGNNYDGRLPANAQLGVTALSRLVEAVRIKRIVSNSVLVTSANSLLGLETQASVTKRAAILLGVDSNSIEKLDTPSTTNEEAIALKEKYGTNINVIVVTDAIHIERALHAFTKVGFAPIPAPTNYRAPLGRQNSWFNWWPATENITLMDVVLHEYLGNLKAMF